MKREIDVSVRIIIKDVGGDSMNVEQIYEDYKKFGIPDYQIPSYTNPEEFTKNIKQCSVLKNVDVCYTTNATSINDSRRNERG